MDQEKNVAQPKISEEERKRRKEYSDSARANIALEGLVVSEEDEAKAQRYVNGEITLEEYANTPPAYKSTK